MKNKVRRTCKVRRTYRLVPHHTQLKLLTFDIMRLRISSSGRFAGHQPGAERLGLDIGAPGLEDLGELTGSLVAGGDAVGDVETGILAHGLDAAHQLRAPGLRGAARG